MVSRNVERQQTHIKMPTSNSVISFVAEFGRKAITPGWRPRLPSALVLVSNNNPIKKPARFGNLFTPVDSTLTSVYSACAGYPANSTKTLIL
jgi:hypothetical protein